MQNDQTTKKEIKKKERKQIRENKLIEKKNKKRSNKFNHFVTQKKLKVEKMELLQKLSNSSIKHRGLISTKHISNKIKPIKDEEEEKEEELVIDEVKTDKKVIGSALANKEIKKVKKRINKNIVKAADLLNCNNRRASLSGSESSEEFSDSKSFEEAAEQKENDSTPEIISTKQDDIPIVKKQHLDKVQICKQDNTNPKIKYNQKYVLVKRSDEIEKARLNLQVVMEEQRIMESINQNDIVLLKAETGSGKSTQIPQLLLENGYCTGCVGITQPRRVVCVSMARRVDLELNSASLGNQARTEVGYHTQIHHLKQRKDDYLEEACNKVTQIHTSLPMGSIKPHVDILVFLTGLDEINQLKQTLLTQLTDIKVVIFHSSIPVNNLLDAVAESNGIRVCVLSTNIAETSLTIPGIAYVVDSGKEKVKVYDSSKNEYRYQIRNISKPSATQRAGRAGRTSDGHCYRLYTADEYDNELSNYKQYVNNDDMLGPELIENAVETLKTLNAINSTNELTTVGQKMVKLAAHPRLAKMLVACSGFKDVAKYCVLIVCVLSLKKPLLSLKQDKSSGLDEIKKVLAIEVDNWRCALDELDGLFRQYASSMNKQLNTVLDPKLPLGILRDTSKMNTIRQIILNGYYDNIAIKQTESQYKVLNQAIVSNALNVDFNNSVFSNSPTLPNIVCFTHLKQINNSKSIICEMTKIDAFWLLNMNKRQIKIKHKKINNDNKTNRTIIADAFFVHLEMEYFLMVVKVAQQFMDGSWKTMKISRNK